KNYNQLETRGLMDVSNFKYSATDLPQSIQITKAKAEFNPSTILLSEFDSKIGSSPLQATGSLTNYMDYFLGENGTLKGQLALISSKFNVNEWMCEQTATDSGSSELTVIELPSTIDFTMSVD